MIANANTPVTSTEFTYTQAKMILANPDTYDRLRVRRAACWMLGYLTASSADIDEACGLACT